MLGRDDILTGKHEADWNYIKQRREDLIRKNNEQENKKRKTHNYQIEERKGKHKNGKKKKELTIWCVAMIDPVTSWFEKTEIKTKRAVIIVNVVETK